jgi:hypothetical protein
MSCFSADRALAASTRSRKRPRSEYLRAGSLISPSSRPEVSRGGRAWRVPGTACNNGLTGSPPAAFRVLGLADSGSSPRRSRSRTSRTVQGDMPATLAIVRSDASGLSRIISAARRRPAARSTGRTLPSRPTLATAESASPAVSRRRARTVFVASAVMEAMTPFDHSGLDARMRRAAAVRSDRVRGRPWRVFPSTDRANASSSVPSKKRTAIHDLPRSSAARRRCLPSSTRMVGRWTMMGGNSSSDSTRIFTCVESSGTRRGESTAFSVAIGTISVAESIRAQRARRNAMSVPD